MWNSKVTCGLSQWKACYLHACLFIVIWFVKQEFHGILFPWCQRLLWKGGYIWTNRLFNNEHRSRLESTKEQQSVSRKATHPASTQLQPDSKCCSLLVLQQQGAYFPYDTVFLLSWRLLVYVGFNWGFFFVNLCAAGVGTSSSICVAMCVNEEFECSVCYFKYDRSNRVPRVLHCHHTFCARCLDTICTTNGAICCVTCPLCRWITCTRSSLSLAGFLFVNTEIWDHLTDDHFEMRDGSVEDLTQHQLVASTL